MRKICPRAHAAANHSNHDLAKQSAPSPAAAGQTITINAARSYGVTAPTRARRAGCASGNEGYGNQRHGCQSHAPSLSREAAQLVTFQTAIACGATKQLVASTEAHSAIMDTAFGFDPAHDAGRCLILPPVLTRAGELLCAHRIWGKQPQPRKPPMNYNRPVMSPWLPTWRNFLWQTPFPDRKKPNQAVMPKNDKDSASGERAVRKPGRRRCRSGSARRQRLTHGAPVS